MCSFSKILLSPFLVLFIFSFFALPAQAKYGGGSGTAEDPYLIETPEQMNAIGANPADWDKHFKLMADIDLSGFPEAAFNIIGQWVAWGSLNNKAFGGVFDGNGKTISNFSYTSANGDSIGLFSYVKGQIKNLGLINPKVLALGWNVGSLVGYLEMGQIISCYAKGASVSGASSVGGLVGVNDGLIVSSYSSGNVAGDAFVGGLVGLLGPGTVASCFSTAKVSGKQQDIGGLVGRTDDELSTISDCYALGSVLGNINVGGLVGQLERGAAAKCYSAGRVSGNQNVGGLIGYMRVLAMIWNCFWDVQTSGQLKSADGIGKTTAEMRMASTFSSAGWDFNNIWTICEGIGYPVLLELIPVGDFRCPDGVNMIDFAWFAQHLRQNNCSLFNSFCSGMDIDHSGSVNFYDLAIFTDHWLEGIAQ